MSSFCVLYRCLVIWHVANTNFSACLLSVLAASFHLSCLHSGCTQTCCNCRIRPCGGARVLVWHHTVPAMCACARVAWYILRLSDCRCHLRAPPPSMWCWCWIGHHWRTEEDILSLIRSSPPVLHPYEYGDDMDADREGGCAWATTQTEQCRSQHW